MPFEQVDNAAKSSTKGLDSTTDAITREVESIYSGEGYSNNNLDNRSDDSADGALPELEIDGLSDGETGTQTSEMEDRSQKTDKNGNGSSDLDGELGDVLPENQSEDLRRPEGNDGQKMPDGKKSEELKKDNKSDQSDSKEEKSQSEKESQTNEQELPPKNNEDKRSGQITGESGEHLDQDGNSVGENPPTMQDPEGNHAGPSRQDSGEVHRSKQAPQSSDGQTEKMDQDGSKDLGKKAPDSIENPTEKSDQDSYQGHQSGQEGSINELFKQYPKGAQGISGNPDKVRP